MSTIVLDARAFGGQAGASARIENYFGFPTGISGLALTARAFNQAQKFGVDMAIPDEVADLHRAGDRFHIALANDERVSARAVVVATGARYRRLEVADLAAFEGSSIHYWASPLEAKLCGGQEVALVGAGNSAGQARDLPRQQGRQGLAAGARQQPRGDDVELSRRAHRRAAQYRGPHRDRDRGTRRRRRRTRERALAASPVGTRGDARHLRHVFLFIGADPNTGWLARAEVRLDDKGFICTDETFDGGRRPLETSRRGVFAVGDVRSGSVKRVAAAVGEGAQVVSTLHAYLSD